MPTRNPTLFESERPSLQKSLALTFETLRERASAYRHWYVAFSGGKDSTATVAAVLYAIESGEVEPPESLTVGYADTRQELPPLHISATNILAAVRKKGYKTRVVVADLDNRFYVYMLGRGVSAPTNVGFRWCTDRIKINPQLDGMRALRERVGEKLLTITGMRLGESAARDERIHFACTRDGGECGQGLLQVTTPDDIADTLSPLLHWRVCHVWDWLAFYRSDHGLPTTGVAEAYGQDEEGSQVELDARTGCVGCNLVEKDVALERVLKLPKWSYLSPLRRVRPLLRELKADRWRHARAEDREAKETKHPVRMGPISLAGREYGLNAILQIQDEVNEAARRQRRPKISLVNPKEEARIRELWKLNVFPRGWTPDAEHAADVRAEVIARKPLPLFPTD